MKRLRMIDENSENDANDLCARTDLSIFSSYRDSVNEDRTDSKVNLRDFKKSKIEFPAKQEAVTKINDRGDSDSDSDKDSENDGKGIKDKPILDYLNLVSSAASMIYEDLQKGKKQESSSIVQQEPRDQASSSQSSSIMSSRTSRSNSVSSEHSVYRSYEMELPEQPLQYNSIKGRLPSPPRLPTASDIPCIRESVSNSYQLNTRRYGELHFDMLQGDNDRTNQHVIKNDNSSSPNQILVRSVIYQ